MKKIMIALVAVALATVSQAASFNWMTSGTNAAKTFYGPDGSSTIAGSTVYLLEASVVSQASLVEGIRGGKTIGDFTTASSAILDTNSRLAQKTFDYGTAGNTYNFYMAIIDGDNVFVSDAKEVAAQQADTVAVSFSGIKTATQSLKADGAYAGAGWYAAVPEPTSGLLMLLGIAGLALRRRRA